MEIMDVSIIIVTSPSPNNPSISMIVNVIESISHLGGLDTCPLYIVLDGFCLTRSGQTSRLKKGRVNEQQADAYNQYYNNLLEYSLSGRSRHSSFKLIKSDVHLGFAMAVKLGLESCNTTFGLVMQHDRQFVMSYNGIPDLLRVMRTDDSIRYIGFPTIANKNHDEVLVTRYSLSTLNALRNKYLLPNIVLCEETHTQGNEQQQQQYLQPLIFWYDSNHLCHIQRYLQIYEPYKGTSQQIKGYVGLLGVKDMLLRPGDFIEDRFGQIQRNLLTTLGDRLKSSKTTSEISNGVSTCDSDARDTETMTEKNKKNRGFIPSEISEEDLISCFRWFGCYLLWLPCKPIVASASAGDSVARKDDDGLSHGDESNSAVNIEKGYALVNAHVMVSHLFGRQTDDAKEENWKLTGMLLRQQHQQQKYLEQQPVEEEKADGDLCELFH